MEKMKNEDHGSLLRCAFKEWYAIVEAIGSGRQNILLRKGGIHEGKKGFELLSENFWLFPTFFHQQLEKLKPEIGLKFIPKLGGTIPIQYYCRTRSCGWIDTEKSLRKIERNHFWTKHCVSEKFGWGPKSGVYWISFSVHKLNDPILIKMQSNYKGCKSWIEIEDDNIEKVTDDQFSEVHYIGTGIAF